MKLDDYQQKAQATSQYPYVGNNIIYPAMGLVGEAGELCDKVKKYWRNTGLSINKLKDSLTSEQVTELLKELGDVMWYISAMCTELGVNMSDVAQQNLDKLYDRLKRGVVKGHGDNR